MREDIDELRGMKELTNDENGNSPSRRMRTASFISVSIECPS